MMILVNGIITGLLDQTITNSIELETGHIKIFPRGYSEKSNLFPTDRYINNYRESEEAINSVKGVLVTCPRIKAEGIIQGGSGSTRVIINGIDFERDSKIRNLEKRIVEGEYFTDDTSSIIVSRTLARSINLEVNSEVFLDTIASDGEPVSLLVVARAFYKTGFPSYDSSMIFLPLSQAQSLLKMESGDITEIVILIDNPEEITDMTTSISSTLKGYGLEHEVLNWEQLSPELVQFAEMERSISFLFLSIVIVVAVIGILNTMLMAVYERFKEIGVMAAFGYKPRNIVSLFMLEGLIIGVIGVLVGCIVGIGIVYYLSQVGITFTGADVVAFMEPHVYPRLSIGNVVFPCVFAIGVALVAALYPAYKASRVEPVEVLRHV
ncbi:MAG: ABC transporter permease [Theionarchaea archaeon]|nr:ABC transporter permease [Theionarchaea archaeon]